MNENEIERNRVDEIIGLHSEICGLLKTSLEKAVRIGELLSEQKASLPHGEFGAWIKANLPFTQRTAQNYMRLFDNREQLKNENVSHLSDGYKLLQGTTQKGLYEQQFEVTKRCRSLQIDMGKAMIAMNELLTPTSEYYIVGTAEPNILFHIENGSLIVYKLLGDEPECGHTEQRYKCKGGDFWWYLDKYINIGRITAIWQEAEIELTDEELAKFQGTTDLDATWDIAGQIVQERYKDWIEDNFVERARKLYDGLMAAYGSLCCYVHQLHVEG